MPDSTIPTDKIIDHRQRAVGRVIVGDEHFDLAIGLHQRGTQRSPQHLAAVVGGNQDADERRHGAKD